MVRYLLPAREAPTTRATRGGSEPACFGRIQRRVRAPVRASCATRTSTPLEMDAWPARARGRCVARSGLSSSVSGAGAAAVRRPRLLPATSTPVSSACTCARRPARASRRPSGYSANVEADDPPDHPERTSSSSILDNIGLPHRRSTWPSATARPSGPADGEILVALESRAPRADGALDEDAPRDAAAASSRTSTFFFQPADIVSQILNFGLPAPIDMQVVGFNQQATHEIALEIAARMSRRFRARPTCTCTRSSTPQPCTSTSIGRGLPSSG